MAQVSLCRLSRQYGEHAAVDDLTLSVEKGELAALLGPSGCGKTTTLRMIAGLLAPSSGDIRFNGRSVLHVAAERRGAVMVFQKHLLFPHMSVGENVGFGLRMRGESPQVIRRKVGEMLALVQLEGFEQRRSHELSGGQQQRVALARALVIEPQVLLLDEPLANLDANLRLEMRKLIRTIQQELAMTTFFVTHDQEEAIMLADRVALMMEGKLLQEGAPRSLYEQPVTPRVARFFRNNNLLPGVKRGAQVQTASGMLQVSQAQHLADGPVWVTVRPEYVRMALPGSPNTLPTRTVGEGIYLGAHVQVEAHIDEHVWTVNLPGDAALSEKGLAGKVGLYLPPESIWLMSR
jgi:ABC-type Fe3+/spermidine/putrescine transport system ATPase subunit